MKRIILGLSIGANLIFASVYDKYIQNQRNFLNQGNVVIKSNSKKNVVKEKEEETDTYLDTTIITDILNSQQTQNSVFSASEKQYLADNVSYQKNISLKSKKEKNKNNNQVTAFYLKGYCEVLNNVKIIASDGFSELRCTLEDEKGDYKNVNVFAKFMPDYKREILIAFPLYAKINGKQYSTAGYFMNSLKTSLNTASKVDSVKIKKLLAKGLLIESDIAYNQATAYLNDLRASRTQTSVTYIKDNNGNSTPIQSKKTEKPKAKDYWTVGIVNSVAALVKLFGENSLYNMTPLFEVNKGDILYTEMIAIRGNKKNMFNELKKFENNLNSQIKKSNQNYEKDLRQGIRIK
jgi:hypothetical protein